MPMKTLAGKTVEVDEEGFLKNSADWTEAMAPELAAGDGIAELTDAHWKVIRFMREDFQTNGQIPTIRRIKNTGGIPTDELYKLFPNGPAKKAARAAGLGKPQGCV
jgi:dissimilatory sulfite reductase related protein